MEISGISMQIAPVQQEPVVEPDPITEEPAQEVAPVVEEPQVVDQEENDSESVKGVIQNLLDGHYKGVSDVRLRINHYEELAAIEQSQTQAAASEGIDALLETVGAGIQEVLGSDGSAQVSDEPTQDLSQDQQASIMEYHETFNQAINQARDGFLAGELNQEDMISNIGNVFLAFVESLEELFTPADEIGAEDTATTDPEEPTDPASPDAIDNSQSNETLEPSTQAIPEYLQTIITNWQDNFYTSLEELTKALSTVEVLPELSEPSGNGVAYNKFLAIYNELRGINTADSSPANTESLNLVA